MKPVEELMSTTNAEVWTQEFLEHTRTVEGMDQSAVHGWFASAIETGRSAGQRSVAMMDIERACAAFHEGSQFSMDQGEDSSVTDWDSMPEDYQVGVRKGIEALRLHLLNGGGQ